MRPPRLFLIHLVELSLLSTGSKILLLGETNRRERINFGGIFFDGARDILKQVRWEKLWRDFFCEARKISVGREKMMESLGYVRNILKQTGGM